MDGLTLRAEDGAALTDEVLDRVARGEQVVVTRADEPVARVIGTQGNTSARAPKQRKRIEEIVAGIKQLRADLAARGETHSHDEIRSLRDRVDSDD